MTDIRQGFLGRCIRDKNGRLVLWQTPNVPIIVWAAARIAVWLLHDRSEQTARIIAFGALFTWAWLELFQGASYFRRALGLVVLAVLIVSGVQANHFV